MLSKIKILIVSLVSISGFLFLSPEENYVSRLRVLRNENDDDYSSRPVIHTFYQQSDVGEEDLLKSWADSWQEVGFQTRVLTLEDAKKHPNFDEYSKIIFENAWDDYNQMCFYRWLAMASTGDGGWMTDYDTFPLNFPIEEGRVLPNNGQFTSFEIFVPSLMSGSAEEWKRVTKMVIDAIDHIPEDTPKTDMFAFREVSRQDDNGIQFLRPDIPDPEIRRGYDYISPHEVNCDAMKFARAVHLSHSKSAAAFNDGLYPIEIENAREQYRSDASRVYLREWKEQCSSSASS